MGKTFKTESARRILSVIVTEDQVKEKLKSINPNIKLIGKYTRMRDRSDFYCSACNCTFNSIVLNIIRRGRCPNCSAINRGSTKKKSHDEFINEMKKINNNLDIIGTYEQSHKKIEVHCRLCGRNYFASPTHLLNGQSCICNKGNKISNSLIKNADLFYEQAYDISPSIEIIGDYKGSRERIKCKCMICGNEWSPIAYSILAGFGCPICSKGVSKLEKHINKYLNDIDIDFVSHKTFSDLNGVGNGKLSYDFYLPDNNILIEVQGVQHERPVDLFGGSNYFNIQKEHDNRKRDYASKHGYKLLEIWYYDSKKYKEIIDSVLKDPVTSKAS